MRRRHGGRCSPAEFEQSALGVASEGRAGIESGRCLPITMAYRPPGETSYQEGKGVPFYQWSC
jgi:hypothetical protein